MITLMARPRTSTRPASVYCSWFRVNTTTVNGKCSLCHSRFHGPPKETA